MGFFKAVGQLLGQVGDLVSGLFTGKPAEPDEPPDRPDYGGEGSRGGGIFTRENLAGDREPPIDTTMRETLLYDGFDVAGWYDRAGDYHDVQNGAHIPPASDWTDAESVVMHFHGGMWDDTYRTVTDIDYDDYEEFVDEIGDVLENAYGTNPI